MQRPDAYSVANLTAYIRTLFDADLRMQDVWVQGEISNFTKARSGHWYFTLKDEDASLRCVMWKGSTFRVHFEPQHGDSILVHGYVSVYEASGQYQLYADKIQPAGQGDLHARFEHLKAELEAAGLFDADRKRPLPFFPKRIGVVTSPTAAAFQDVQNVLRRRFPVAEVLLSPTLVQGDEAPVQIVAALQRINRANVDVILLIRGGGSLEDLWAFNDERVAYAIADSAIPVVSGVGHEIDFTIADFVADHRAPTPSAAAEIATPNLEDLIYTLQVYRERLADGIVFQLAERRRLVLGEARILGSHSPQHRVDNARQRVDDLYSRSGRALQQIITLQRERLLARQGALHSADPRAILERGYAIVERTTDGKGVGDGVRVRSASDVTPDAQIDVHFAAGHLRATVNTTSEEE